MSSVLYNATSTCGICKFTFETIKVRFSKLRQESCDSDFFIKYKDVQPILYEVCVCENCGYSDFVSDFEKGPHPREKLKIKERIGKRWKPKNYNCERDPKLAIECYKLLYANLIAREASYYLLAKTAIRMGWIYRLAENKEEESKYLKMALKYYHETYEYESLPIGKFDESTCIYMIGELYRRTEDKKESKIWFSKILSLAYNKKNPKIQNMVSDRLQDLKSN